MNKQELQIKYQELKLKEIYIWLEYAKNNATPFEHRQDAIHLVNMKLLELHE
jgi:hypothetical protein